MAQPGSAPAWGAGGREFESRYSDQDLIYNKSKIKYNYLKANALVVEW
jgi:hypothetical protein